MSSDAEDVEEDGAPGAAAEVGNEGWADVMSRLLNAPAPKKKYVILSKAKKAVPKDEAEEEVEEESDPGFEVEGAEPKPAEKKKRKTAVRSRAVKRKEDVEKRKKVKRMACIMIMVAKFSELVCVWGGEGRGM